MGFILIRHQHVPALARLQQFTILPLIVQRDKLPLFVQENPEKTVLQLFLFCHQSAAPVCGRPHRENTVPMGRNLRQEHPGTAVFLPLHRQRGTVIQQGLSLGQAAGDHIRMGKAARIIDHPAPLFPAGFPGQAKQSRLRQLPQVLQQRFILVL